MFICALVVVLQLAVTSAADVSTLNRLATGLGGIAYYTDPVFANGLVVAKWEQRNAGSADQWTEIVAPQTQPTLFNSSTLLPLRVDAARPVRGITWGLHIGISGRPSSWPEVKQIVHGITTIVWSGAADVRPSWCAFVPALSSGAATGVLVDGRRAYNCSDNGMFYVTIFEAADAARPLGSLKVLLPDPEAPLVRSLPDNALFHPQFIKHLNVNSPKYSLYRFMDLFETNAIGVRDWSERNKPTHAAWGNTLADRGPFEPKFTQRHGSGIPYEFAPALCNLQSVDCWINVPHMATDDFITNMARVMRFGSDASGTPLTADGGSPAWAPLRADLRLFVEYSNEIWSNGPSFAQGEWAEAQGTPLGLNKPQFNAKRSCEIWAIFERVFGDARKSQLVRVAAAFTALDSYTLPYLQHMSKTAGCAPDIVAVTTYFGNGIQDHVFRERRDIWYDHHNISDSYWLDSAEYLQDLDDVYDEWLVRILSASPTAGGGFDANGLTGGFSLSSVRAALNTTMWNGRTLAVVAYEGGPSLYTDYIDNSWTNTPETIKTRMVTAVCEELNRKPRMEEVYRSHLTLAFARGLQQHSQFTEHGGWGKYGQWGARESVFFTDEMQPKLRALAAIDADWKCVSPSMMARQALLTDDSTVPLRFTTRTLPFATFNSMYDAEIRFTLNGATPPATGVVVQVIATANVRGLSVLTACASKPGVIRIVGIPQRPRAVFGYIMLRLSTPDGSAATVATFQLTHVGAPDSVLTADLSAKGVCMGATAPITATLGTPSAALVSTYTGVTINSLTPVSAESGCKVRSSPPATPGTLAQSITDKRYLTLRFTTARAIDLRDAVLSLGLTRDEYHADRQFAVFVNAFAATDRVGGTDTEFTSMDPTVLPFILAGNVSRLQIAANADVEIRIVPFGGQYSHAMTYNSIGIKITRGVPTVAPISFDAAGARSSWCSDYLTMIPCQAYVPPSTTTSTTTTPLSNGATPAESTLWASSSANGSNAPVDGSSNANTGAGASTAAPSNSTSVGNSEETIDASSAAVTAIASLALALPLLFAAQNF